METKQPAIVIYNDGTAEVVAPISIGAIESAIRGLQKSIANFTVGPQIPAPTPQEDEENE